MNTNFMPDATKLLFRTKALDWVNDTYKVMLCTAGYTPSPDDQYASAASGSEVSSSGTGYTGGFGGSGRKTLANKTATIVSVTGTAQAGGASSITLASGASAVDGYYVGSSIRITGGTSVGEVARIIAYNGTTKIATLDAAWTAAPDNTSTYKITSVKLDADDSVWAALTATVRHFVIIKEVTSDADSPIVLVISRTTLPATAGGGSFTATWDAAGLFVEA